jgi:hypothetical protein
VLSAREWFVPNNRKYFINLINFPGGIECMLLGAWVWYLPFVSVVIYHWGNSSLDLLLNVKREHFSSHNRLTIGLNQQQTDEPYDSTALEAYTPLLLLIAMYLIFMFSDVAQDKTTQVYRSLTPDVIPIFDPFWCYV